MNTFDMNVVFFSYLDALIKVVLIDPKFAFRPSCDHMVRRSCADFRVNSEKDILASQLVFVSDKGIKTSDVEGYACSQGIIKFFSRNKVFGKHDFLRKIATLKGFVDLARGDHVNMCDAQTANESHN